MIFKTWLKDLSNVQGVINQLNNLGTGASITQMATAVSGLSKEQAILALSSRKLTEDQMKQVLVEAKLLESTISLTTAQATERLSKSLNSEADAKVLLQKYALITHQKLEKNSTLEVTAAKLQEAVANGTLSATEATAIANAYGLTIANGAQTASWKLLTSAIWQNVKAMGAWLVSNPLGWLTLAVGAIAGLTAGFVYLSQSTERAKDKLEESAEAFSQAKSEVENLNSELQTTKQRIDELSAKENLTLVESEELDKLKETNKELERELRLRESIALEKGKQANEDAIDYFGSQSTYGTTAGNIDISGDQLEILDFQLEKIKDLEEYFKTADAENKDFLFIQNEKLLSFLKEETARTIEEFMELDDSLMEGYDEGYLDRLDKLYQKYDEIANGVAQSHTNTITGVLEKVDFKDNKEQLIELGKNGSLSVETLTSKFPVLIEYLENAGVSAQELYQYIMALANPDAVKYDELKHQLQDVMGFGDGIHTLWAVDMDKQLQDLGLYNEDALEVFATIKAKYVNGETESWTPEDWIANIQEGLESLSQNPDEITVLNITDSIKQIATQLEPQFSKLQDAYQSIFTVEDGKQIFSLDDVDVSMLEDLRKSFAEIEEEIGVTFDASQLENFFDVLTNGNSTAEEVQNAFNGLATSYLFSTDVLNNLNDTTVDAIAKQLESLGVTNATALATEVLATKQEYLAQTGQDLSDATAENINALIDEKAEITEEGIVLDDTTQKIIAYWMQKQAANGQLSTIGDIQQLGALCDALGISTKALRNYIYFKKLASMTDVYDENTIAIFAENAEKQMEQAQKDIQSIYAGFGGTNLDYSPIDSKKASKSAKDTTESFDWIERAIESLQKRFNSLQQVIDSTFSTTGAKTKALVDQIGLINKEIELQQQAYESYMQKAESVGLSDEYKNLVQNGSINIEDITDEDLQKAIKLYQDYYDKAQDTLEKINDLNEEAKQKHVDGYELEADELKRKLDNQSITEKQYIDDMLALWEKYYDNQVEYAEVAKQKKLDILEEEKSYLQSVGSAAIALLDDQIDDLEDQKEAAVKGYEAEIEAYESKIDAVEEQIEVYEEKIDAVEEQIDVIESQIDVIEEKKDALQDHLDSLEKERQKEDEILSLQKAQYELEKARNQRTKLQFQDGQMTYVTDNSAIKTAQDNVDDAEFAITKRGIQDQIDGYDRQIDGLNKQIDGLNKVIDGYNKEIDSLNKVIDGYDKQIDKLNDLIDQTEKYYDSQIKGLNEYKEEWQKAIDMEELAVNMQNFIDKFGEGSIGKLLSGDMSLITEWKQSYLDTLAEIDITSNGTIGDITKKFADLAGIDLSGVTEQTSSVASQFDALKDSVTGTASAIGSVGTGNGGEDVSEGTNSLVGAIDTSYQVASEKLPAEAEMMNELTEATKLVSSAIGGDSENGDKKGGQSDSANSLVGAIDASYQTASEKLPAETEMMNGLTESTILANTEVKTLADAIDSLKDKTVTITIKTVGSIPSLGGSGASGSATANGTAHVEGTAKVTGDWGVRQGGKTLVGELGQEIVVRNGHFFTVGDNGTEFVDLQKGDIVFNHLQSKELLSKGNIVGRGNALAEGTLQKSSTPSYLRPIQEGDKGYELIKAARVYQDMLKTNIMLPVNSIDKNVEMMTRNISAVNTNNVNKPTLTINGGINVSCPSVNGNEIANQVSAVLHKEFDGMALDAKQKANMRR